MRGQGRGQGRGKGRGHGRGGRNRRRMLGFLQPCILLQLHDQDLHGYELLQGLGEFMEDAAEYDPSVIYRLMKEMEENGAVSSYEGEVSRGPKRKMYRITEAGKSHLQFWIQDLKRSRDEIDALLDAYKRRSSK